jgi:CheY-like chemotaxis protein
LFFLFQPLSAFIHGFEGFKESLSEATDFLLSMNTENDRDENRQNLASSITFMKTTLNSLVGAYQVLLMKINRFTDYTKFTHGIPLIPTMEAIHLYDALYAPISCVQDLQSRINIELEGIEKGISEYIITDRQWLQDNILCLVYNAVKFSLDGDHAVSIRVYLTSASPSRSSTAPSPAKPKTVHFCQEEKESHAALRHDLEAALNQQEEPRVGAKMVRIEVEDHGIGISMGIPKTAESVKDSCSDISDIVFSEPDMTKKRESNVGGNGLGLFCLAKRLDALDGEYGAEEKKGSSGKGSLFWFSFPYVADHWKLKSVESLHSSHGSRHHSPRRRDSFDLKVCDSIGNTLKSDDEDRKGDVSNTLVICSSPQGSRSSTNSSGAALTMEVNLQSSARSKSNGSIKEEKNQEPVTVKSASRQSSFTNKSPGHDKLEPTMTLINSLSKSGDSLDTVLAPTFTVPSPRKQRILVVDDSLPIVKMLKIMLEKNGFHVSIASNGLEAVETVRKLFQSQSYSSLLSGKNDIYHYPPFDAVLMDIQMPIMDGLEATTKIRELERELVNEPENIRSNDVCSSSHLIVAMSASSDDETINSAYNAGADEFISKPFNLHSFQRILEEYNQRRRLSKRSHSFANEKTVRIFQNSPPK